MAKTCSFQCRRKRDSRNDLYTRRGEPLPPDKVVPPPRPLRTGAVDYRRTYGNRACEHCGTEYAANEPDQRFCTQRCGHKHVHGESETRHCEICVTATFTVPRSSKKRTCSRACGFELQRLNRGWAPKVEKWPSSKIYFIDCVQCGKAATVRNAHRKACSPECSKLRRNATQLAYMNNRYAQVRPRVIDRVHRGRTRRAEIPAERIDIRYLGRRDKWTCQLCKLPVKPFADCGKRDPLSPSVDHIVPVTLGGPHIYANVQLAHLECNRAKGNRMDKRLAEAMLNAFAEQYAHQH